MDKGEVICFLANYKDADSEKILKEHGMHFEPSRLERLKKVTNKNARKELICTGLLLYKVLEKYGYSSKDVCIGAHGKPGISDSTDFFFNISHSGVYILIALSGQEIGADIQKSVTVKKALVDRITAGEDKDAGDVPINLVWAIKESYTKLTGLGILREFSEISYDILDDNILISDNGAVSATGVKVFSQDGYEAVVAAHEAFKVKAFNRVIL